MQKHSSGDAYNFLKMAIIQEIWDNFCDVERYPPVILVCQHLTDANKKRCKSVSSCITKQISFLSSCIRRKDRLPLSFKIIRLKIVTALIIS